MENALLTIGVGARNGSTEITELRQVKVASSSQYADQPFT